MANLIRMSLAEFASESYHGYYVTETPEGENSDLASILLDHLQHPTRLYNEVVDLASDHAPDLEDELIEDPETAYEKGALDAKDILEELTDGKFGGVAYMLTGFQGDFIVAVRTLPEPWFSIYRIVMH